MSRRALLRREARADARKRFVPVVPGVVADRSKESFLTAAEEAEVVLPPLRGTELVVAFLDIAEGLDTVLALFGEDGVARIRAKLEALPADAAQPSIMLATRKYRDVHLRNPSPTEPEGSPND